jgi:hypothetical protein
MYLDRCENTFTHNSINRGGTASKSTTTNFVSTDTGKFALYGLYGSFSNNYFSVADSDDFTLGTKPFSISVWIKLSNSTAQSDLFAKSTGGDPDMIFGLYGDSGVKFQFQQYVGSSLQVNLAQNANGPSVSTGTYYHYMVERFGLVTRLYINGYMVSSKTESSTPRDYPNYTGVWYWLTRNSSDADYCRGTLDDPMVIVGDAIWRGKQFINSLPNRTA